MSTSPSLSRDQVRRAPVSIVAFNRPSGEEKVTGFAAAAESAAAIPRKRHSMRFICLEVRDCGTGNGAEEFVGKGGHAKAVKVLVHPGISKDGFADGPVAHRV